MAQTKYDLASRALTRVGGKTIATFGTGSAEEIAAAQEYEPRARAALAGNRWRFATDQADLGSPLVNTPAARYANAFQLPADLLTLHGVFLTGTSTPISYDRLGTKIFCDESEGIVCEHTFRAPEAIWAPNFTEAFVNDLAAVFAIIIARDTELSETLRKEGLGLWAIARSTDSQQQTTRRVVGSRIVAARR